MDKAIKLQSGFHVAYCKKGLCYFELKNYAKAISSFDNAIALDPKNGRYYFYKGKALYEEKRNIKMNYEDIKKLIDDMGNSKLTEISIDFPDGTKIGMKKEVKVVEKVQEKNIQHIEQKEVNEIVETETQEDNCKIVKSPMVGTFYLKPDPNSNY